MATPQDDGGKQLPVFGHHLWIQKISNYPPKFLGTCECLTALPWSGPFAESVRCLHRKHKAEVRRALAVRKEKP